jgi:hypothetical protein
MKIQTVLNFRTIIISALVLSLSMMAHAQEKPANPDDDTTKYVPYRMMLGHRVAKSKYGELNIRPYTYFRYLNQRVLIQAMLMASENKRVDKRRIFSYKK